MANLSRYDDPAVLDRFLQVIRGNSQSAKPETGSNNPLSKLDPQSPEFSPKIAIVAGKQVENDSSRTSNGPQDVQSSSGQEPILAPFLSPFPQPSVAQKAAAVDVVQDQNGLFIEPATTAVKRTLSQEDPNVTAAARKRPLTPTQHRLLVGKKSGIEHLTEDKLAELRKQTQGYINNVVERFRMSRDQKLAQDSVAGDHVPPTRLEAAPSSTSSPSDGGQESNPDMPDPDGMPITPEASGSKNDTPIKSSGQKEQWQEESPDTSPYCTPVADSTFEKGDQEHGIDYLNVNRINDSPEVVPFPSFTEGAFVPTIGNEKGASEAVAAFKYEPLSTHTHNPQAHGTGEEDESSEEAAAVMSNATGSDTPWSHNHSPAIVVTASTDTDDSAADDVEDDEGDDDEQEDRENLVHFKSWGIPAARDKPISRPRTVILTGLPRCADFTFVQSLIHGGAIERMRLIAPNPARITISAHVTFTSADACDRYYDEHLKGMEVNYQGRKRSVLVHKKEQVDVISGMLQGYLECGATRVVKVSGIDFDWGIMALNKLAEGKTRTRQVEAVQDTYRNGIRTIHFRFANISHAVEFKNSLIRSESWYGCHVEFAEDPCEKASGIHND